MNTMEELVKEVHTLRIDLENIRDAVKLNGVLPVFYRRLIVAALILCALSLVTAIVATWRVVVLEEGVQRIYTTLEQWQLTE